MNETIAIGEKGGLPTQISHAKVVGVANWGRSADMLALVDAARARGVDVTIDQYPYTASSTSVAAALIPAWVLEGGREATLARLKDSGSREKAKGGIAMMIRDERGGGDPKNVQFANCGFDPSLAGKTLADLTRARGMAPTIGNAAEVVMWIVEQGGCQGIFHAMSERDLVRIMRHPATMIASDGEVPVFGRANPHPRSYGTFARVLGVYVREKKVLTLEDAVRKMSAFPAARLGLIGSRRAAPGHEGGHRGLRRGDGAGHGDVREAPPVRGGLLARDRQRPGGLRERRDDRAPGPAGCCMAWPRSPT